MTDRSEARDTDQPGERPTRAASPGERLRAVIEAPGCSVLPGVYDALTAILGARAGFEALYLTGSGVAYTQLGRADLGFVGLRDMVERAWAITGAVQLPVLADADTGYGGPLQVIHTIRAYERAGLAGAQLEDQVWPKRCGHYDGVALIPQADMVAKVRAALDARRDPSFVIVARTDARRASGLTEAIERAHAYQEAGADVIFIEALASEAEMRTVTAGLAVPAMANMVEGGRTPLLSATDLARAGYALVIFPNAVTRIVARAVSDGLAELRQSGTTGALRDSMLDFTALSDLVGLPADTLTEAQYAPGMDGTPTAINATAAGLVAAVSDRAEVS